ncbi:MAG: DUF1778 domain-containing protein [Acetobacteraceae bacterium]
MRLTPSAKRTLQRAASAPNKTLSELLLDSSLHAAHATLADRRAFVLDEGRWDESVAALSAPPSDNPRLRALLARRPASEP